MNASGAAIAAARELGLCVAVEPLGEWLRGESFADGFIACAVWHELHHHHHPGASEAAAHAFARERCGADPEIFAVALRPEGRP